MALPFGIYDVAANLGAVFVGVSHDTPAFAAHAIAQWWQLEDAIRYPNSRRILLLADGGGSNGCRPRAWKTELQSQLTNRFGLTVATWDELRANVLEAVSVHFEDAPSRPRLVQMHYVKDELIPLEAA